jgi:hypothetical protein
MVTRHDYGKSEVEACLSVLVELMTILGESRDHIVLTWGRLKRDAYERVNAFLDALGIEEFKEE